MEEELLRSSGIHLEMESPVKRKDYWALLRNVIKAVALFRSCEAEQAQVGSVVDGILQIPTDRTYQQLHRQNKENSPESIAIKDIRRDQRLIECIERGSPADLETIKELVDSDPYKHLVLSSSPHSFINKKSLQGYSPLYSACKHGNLEVVKLLLALGADHSLACVVDNETEDCLEVAVRWGHTKVVELLLTKNWPKASHTRAYKAARAPQMRKLLKAHRQCAACCECF